MQSPKKPDYTNDVIDKLAESSPEFAEKIFSKLQRCDPHGRECGQRTKVELMGKSKYVCAGKAHYKMTPSDFEDAKKFIAAVSAFIKATKP